MADRGSFFYPQTRPRTVVGPARGRCSSRPPRALATRPQPPPLPRQGARAPLHRRPIGRRHMFHPSSTSGPGWSAMCLVPSVGHTNIGHGNGRDHHRHHRHHRHRRHYMIVVIMIVIVTSSSSSSSPPPPPPPPPPSPPPPPPPSSSSSPSSALLLRCHRSRARRTRPQPLPIRQTRRSSHARPAQPGRCCLPLKTAPASDRSGKRNCQRSCRTGGGRSVSLTAAHVQHPHPLLVACRDCEAAHRGSDTTKYHVTIS